MEINRLQHAHKESGFALLMSLIVVGVLISIGLTVLELSIKQVQLSTNARDSEIAFHAANAGMECSRYTRRVSSSTMENGGAISPTCFQVGSSPGTVNPTQITSGLAGSGSGDVFLYDYSFTWGAGSDRCTEVTTLVASSTFSATVGASLIINNMDTYVPGFADTSNSVACEAGARCTVISVRGYNQPCNATSSFGTVQREVLLQF